MKIEEKKLFYGVVFGCIMFVLIAILGGCSYPERGGTTVTSFNGANEWISPDGVHYWSFGNGGVSPRYDHNGNLVID